MEAATNAEQATTDGNAASMCRREQPLLQKIPKKLGANWKQAAQALEDLQMVLFKSPNWHFVLSFYVRVAHTESGPIRILGVLRSSRITLCVTVPRLLLCLQQHTDEGETERERSSILIKWKCDRIFRERAERSRKWIPCAQQSVRSVVVEEGEGVEGIPKTRALNMSPGLIRSGGLGNKIRTIISPGLMEMP